MEKIKVIIEIEAESVNLFEWEGLLKCFKTDTTKSFNIEIKR